MSSLCLVDLKNHNLDFNNLNKLAIELVNISLENSIAIFFNSYDYGYEIIKEANMKNFFLMSDSFLYRNCDFLDDIFFDNVSDIEDCREKFMKKFNFFNKILNTIFKYDVHCIEIYITTDGAVDCLDDFDCLKCNSENFLQILFNSIFGRADEYAYGFPTVRFEINN